MIPFAGIAVLIGMLFTGFIMILISVSVYLIFDRHKSASLSKIFIFIGISIMIYPILFFYMMVSNHEKQIKEEYVYNEEFTETFLDSDQSTGFRLVVVDCVAGSKIYELEKTLDGGKNWILINKDPFHGKSGLVKEINFEYEDYGCIVITNVSGTRLTKFVTYDGGITFSETESYFTDNGY